MMKSFEEKDCSVPDIFELSQIIKDILRNSKNHIVLITDYEGPGVREFSFPSSPLIFRE